MITFEVKDMTCGHCISTITEAVNQVDKEAKVTADLPAHLISISASSADEATLSAAIAAAGYTPTPVHVSSRPSTIPPVKAAGGCCCG
jgi:copper chaperone